MMPMTANKQLYLGLTCIGLEEKLCGGLTVPFRGDPLGKQDSYLLGEGPWKPNEVEKWKVARERWGAGRGRWLQPPGHFPTSVSHLWSLLHFQAQPQEEVYVSSPNAFGHSSASQGGRQSDWIVSPRIVSPQAALP